MKIKKIQIRNYLSITDLVWEPKGTITKAKGDNDTGKTTFLNAIRDAIKSSGADPDAVQIGKDKAEIIIDLDNDVSITRKITKTSNTVKVVANGEEVSKAQTYLNTIFGPYIFDPSAFVLEDAKTRTEMVLQATEFQLTEQDIRNAIGDRGIALDLSTIDYNRHGLKVLNDVEGHIYKQRTEQGREKDRLKKAIIQDRLEIPETFDADKWKCFDLKTTVDNLAEARGLIQANQADSDKLELMRQNKVQLDYDIDALDEKIQQFQSEMKRSLSRRENMISEGIEFAKIVSSFVRPDTESIQDDIDGYEGAQSVKLKLEGIEKRTAEADTATERHTALDDLYKAFTGNVRREIMAGIEFPIEGLEFKDDKIYVKNISLSKLSTKDGINIGVDIAMSTAGKLKCILVDRFESFSDKNKLIFAEKMGKTEYHAFVTEVTSGELSIESSDD